MKHRVFQIVLVTMIILAGGPGRAGAQEMPLLEREFDLAAARSQDVQVFSMESRLIEYALDGTIAGTFIMRLGLKCVPADVGGTEADEYTCLGFTLGPEGGPELHIPALEGWSHAFDERGMDEKGQVFGIDSAQVIDIFI